MNFEDYKKGGYDKYNLKKDYIEEVHSRISQDGKVYRGDAGRNLKRKKLEQQAYFQRNSNSKWK